ncbi:DegQ family serine endoprotease [Laribacter hongkongensis]|uniref:DegQ family serine endoprotease n=1 Tax=Laribacter hongkongensis TaxID=168471 RepID=UPI001EFE7034|nr:DegQ family serine endoprotease [Laribacter hongkongensis]MCG9094207.1 DegQ family serine endoprotease [Laribacter hongkongensis]
MSFTLKQTFIASSLALSLALSASPSALAASQPPGLPNFAQLVDKEGRAVVNISARQNARTTAASPLPDLAPGDPFFEFFRRFAPPQQQREEAVSLGSGFIISPDGYILTNAHVVARGDEITVKLNDKREYKARLIGADGRTDVALLKIDAHNLPAVELGNPNTLRVGEWVLAIGSPFGFDNTVTSGIVSAKGRQLPDENYVPFIQTDVAVNPGNSGGPLFDMDGKVVGINSQIYSRSGGFMGISFAIPIDVAMQVADQLKQNGRVSRGRLGVQIQDLTKDLAASFGLKSPSGALVNSVEAGGPADKAGIRAGDIVLAVNGQAIKETSDLPRLIGAVKPGQATRIEIWRNQASRTVTVVPDELREADARSAQREAQPKQPTRPAQQQIAPVGLVLADAPPQLLQRLGIRFGLVVQRTSGLATQAGLLPGDVIVGIGTDPVTSFGEFKARIDATPAGAFVPLKVMRGNATLFLPLPVAK